MSVYLRMNHKKKFSGFTDFNPPQQTKGRKRTSLKLLWTKLTLFRKAQRISKLPELQVLA